MLFRCRRGPLNLSSHTQLRTSKPNYWNGLPLERCMTHDVTPQTGSALRLLSKKQRGPHIPVQSARVLVMILSSYPASQNQTVSLCSPCRTKNLCHSGTRSCISLLSHPPALEAFSMNGRPLPVLTHHKSASTQPTQSSPGSPLTSLVDLPNVSARSIEHCATSLLGPKLTEEQFSTLLHNSRRQHLISLLTFFPRETRNLTSRITNRHALLLFCYL